MTVSRCSDNSKELFTPSPEIVCTALNVASEVASLGCTRFMRYVAG